MKLKKTSKPWNHDKAKERFHLKCTRKTLATTENNEIKLNQPSMESCLDYVKKYVKTPKPFYFTDQLLE